MAKFICEVKTIYEGRLCRPGDIVDAPQCPPHFVEAEKYTSGGSERLPRLGTHVVESTNPYEAYGQIGTLEKENAGLKSKGDQLEKTAKAYVEKYAATIGLNLNRNQKLENMLAKVAEVEKSNE